MDITNNSKEVYFEWYCDTCLHSEKSELEDPCDECLAKCYNENSHKPINWEGKK